MEIVFLFIFYHLRVREAMERKNESTGAILKYIVRHFKVGKEHHEVRARNSLLIFRIKKLKKSYKHLGQKNDSPNAPFFGKFRRSRTEATEIWYPSISKIAYSFYFSSDQSWNKTSERKQNDVTIKGTNTVQRLTYKCVSGPYFRGVPTLRAQ